MTNLLCILACNYSCSVPSSKLVRNDNNQVSEAAEDSGAAHQRDIPVPADQTAGTGLAVRTDLHEN